MLKRCVGLLGVLGCLAVGAYTQEVATLEVGQTIERELAGGQVHNYRLTLAAGQFLRVVVEQKGIDVAVALVAPDGKQMVETNLAGRAFGQESLSREAVAGGDYRIVVRPVVATAPKGIYQARLEVKAAATAQDKQRIAAEGLLAEALKLSQQGAASIEPTLEKAQQALTLWRALADRYWEANTLNLIGNALMLSRKYDQAIEAYSQALPLRREAKDRAGEASTLYNLGNAHQSLSQYEKAIEYREQALQISRELKNRAGEASALIGLSSIHSSLSRYEKAIEYREQALQIFRELKDRANEATTLGSIGNALLNLARYERGIEYIEQALQIRRELKDRAGEAAMLNQLGMGYGSISRYEKALEYHEQALRISRELKDRAGERFALAELGRAYRLLGSYEKALEYAEQARTIYRELNSGRGDDYDPNEFGQLYRVLGNYEKALEYHERALRNSRETKRRSDEITSLTYLGHTYYSLGRYEKARECYEQALPISREVKNREFEGIVLNRLGMVYRLLNRAQEAIGYHMQALQIVRETKIATHEAGFLYNLMLAWKALKEPSLAIFFGKQSVNVYQEIRSNIRSLAQNSQQSFVKDKEETYRELADLLIAQGRLPEAEQVIRMLKEEEYFEFIRRDQANTQQQGKAQLTPEEAALEKRYREISDQLAGLGVERGALLEKPARTPFEEQRLAKLEADLIVAGQAFQKFLDSLATELGKNQESSTRMTNLRESQALMEDLRELGRGTIALYTLVGETKFRLLLTTADVQKAFEYPIKAEELNRKVLEFRAALQNPQLDPMPLARELYKIIVAPVAQDLKAAKAETLMWSLDGVLRYVPIAALHDGEKYLVERYRNVVFTVGSYARLKDVPSRRWNALGLGVTKSFGERVPALPGVLEEMRGIIRDESTGAKTGVLPGTIKLDEQFTQEAMLAGLRQRPPVVHVASHFQFQPGNETNSALLLGDGKFLSLAQIKTLPNVFGGVELLTLSACNTATSGSGANGKEVEGFGVLAQRQGAKAVVASLWPVADRSTKYLMQEFYRLREVNASTTKAEALRQAQLKLLRGALQVEGETLAAREIVHEADKAGSQPKFKLDTNRPYAHPYYWAPFILIGNWK